MIHVHNSILPEIEKIQITRISSKTRGGLFALMLKGAFKVRPRAICGPKINPVNVENAILVRHQLSTKDTDMTNLNIPNKKQLRIFFLVFLFSYPKAVEDFFFLVLTLFPSKHPMFDQIAALPLSF